MSSSKRRKHKKWKITIWSIVIVFVLVIGGMIAYVSLSTLEPLKSAQAAMQPTEQVEVVDKKEWIEFQPKHPEGVSVIFYQGAFVEEASYAPLAQLLAQEGHPVYLMKMPANLAFAGGNSATKVMEAYPQQSFVIGGHSLGGAMAARFAADHADTLAGMFLLGSYADEKGSVRDTGLPVISIIGDKDNVVNRENVEKGRDYLPPDTIYYNLPGGNHAQYGDYGPQKGDGTADITMEEQVKLTADSLLSWMNQIKQTK
ncbi:alpha/beta fold hydrolase [Paenibacillus sp. Marseille-Q4541]|uniref:alpha/beta fold hydrolase n=1 Tax=Paenibacillus sp. Marseille-Q4541 TaxID=2831522 RepID=UPI001BA6C8B2|nr:alpha/beta fold hydrolase [Paenibacillus sp. Marseille-Q4541]